MKTLIITLIGLFLLALFFSDPLIIFLGFSMVCERKLKKQLPETSMNGKALIEHALKYGDENAQKTARRGALFQWVYSLLCFVLLFFATIIFAFKQLFVVVAILSFFAVLFFYWVIVYRRLWLYEET